MTTLPVPLSEAEIATPPTSVRDLLLAAALVAALLMLSLLTDLLQQNIERGARIRDAQRADATTLVSRSAAAGQVLQDQRLDLRAVASVTER